MLTSPGRCDKCLKAKTFKKLVAPVEDSAHFGVVIHRKTERTIGG
jgi:hypothetical protein